jgi:membrane protein YqaA with SNARE-associated domain
MQIVNPTERYCALALNVIVQNADPHRGHGFTRAFRHFGALGLFALAILDSSPVPTFAGTDILTAILAATHRNPWYEYAGVATAGSVLGAYLTFRVARRAGSAYFERHFRHKALSTMLSLFQTWASGALAVSTALPLPFPTSVFFVAAGASNYPTRRFVTVVALSRAARYVAIAVIADRYGRHFVHALRHPGEYWIGLLLSSAVLFSTVVAGILLNRRLVATLRV